jgi:ABC-type transport system substrate-binding protein
MDWVRVVAAALAAFLAAAVAPAWAGNVVRWASAIPGLTFDPHAFNHGPTIAQNMQVYEVLIDIDPDNRMRPSLAVSWRLTDLTTWELELRRGVRFHDGTPFTAEDVVFSLRRAVSVTSDVANNLPPIAAVEATGPYSNPFRDRRVRQAIYQAIDIEAIRTGIMKGYAVPAGIIVEPGVNGYAPELDARPPYDPAAAKALLAEAGYPGGFEVALDCPSDRYRNDVAICRAVVEMLGRVGIVVTPRIGPAREHFPKVRHRQTDFYMQGWGSTFDSYDHFVTLYRSDGPYNGAGYADPEVDRLVDAIGAELATYARDALIEQVWRRVLTEVVYVPLHHQVLVWALRDGLELPIDPLDWPRMRLARFKGASSG